MDVNPCKNIRDCQLLSICNGLDAVNRRLYMADACLAGEDYEGYLARLSSACHKLESQCLCLRDVISTNSAVVYDASARPIDFQLAEQVYHISVILQDDDVLRIRLPVLLPHYKAGHKNVLVDPLSSALKAYKNSGKIIPDYRAVVFVFVNCVRGKSKSVLRDNDNYEYKQIVNTLSFWLLSDDGHQQASMYNATQIGGENATEIYVVPASAFGGWYNQNIAKQYCK